MAGKPRSSGDRVVGAMIGGQARAHPVQYPLPPMQPVIDAMMGMF
jgi:hypothetical protein